MRILFLESLFSERLLLLYKVILRTTPGIYPTLLLHIRTLSFSNRVGFNHYEGLMQSVYKLSENVGHVCSEIDLGMNKISGQAAK